MPEPLTVGGQAVIEGVMMRGPKGYAIAVRRMDGSITTEATPHVPLARKVRFLKLPVIRGAASLIEMMLIGLRALEFSANHLARDEAEAAARNEGRERKHEKEGELSKVALALTFIFSICVGMTLFVVVPNLVTMLLGKIPSGGKALLEEKMPVTYNLISGAIRMVIVVGYIYLISLMKDVRRLFQYHGAEHKAVRAFESGAELTVENVRPFTTLHPRCGTTFIAIVLLVSIVVFAFFARVLVAVWPEFAHYGLALRKAILIFGHILIMPIVAGVCFELLKLGGKFASRPAMEAAPGLPLPLRALVAVPVLFLKALIAPGFWFQRLTTRQPDDSMIEVAIASLQAALSIEDSQPQPVNVLPSRHGEPVA